MDLFNILSGDYSRMKVKQGLLKYVSPSTPVEARLKAAVGEDPEAAKLPPEDRVTVLFVLCYDKDETVRDAARKSFEVMPVTEVVAALGKRLDPVLIRRLVAIYKDNEAVLTMAALNPGVDDETLTKLAEFGPEEVVTCLIEDKTRMIRNPAVLEGLRKNPLVPKSVVGSIETCLATRGAEAPGAPGPEAGEIEDDEAEKGLTEEKDLRAESDEHNIFKLMQNLNVAKKIKLAITGNKAAREYLIKETNKIVALAVLKNPRITEEEIARLSASKSTPEDLLRTIARNKEWVKSYGVRLNMVQNSKTPLNISLRLMEQLYEKDLVKLAKSKNVSSVLATAARRKLEAKQKR